MSPLKLANIGYVALKHISKQADEMSLLSLAISLYNTKSQFVAEKKKIEFINVNIHDDKCIITIKFGRRREVFWEIAKVPSSKIGRRDKFDLRGTKLKNKRHQTRDKYCIYSKCNNDIIACQKIVEILFSVFIPNEFNFYIGRKCNLSNVMKFKGLNIVDDLTFIVYFKMTDEEFVLFREKVHPKKSLSFNCFNYENQNHGSLMNFNYDTLELCSAKWLTEDDFFRINCKNVSVKISFLTHKVMNTFIKKWMKGETKIENMKIEIQDTNLDEVLDGIESKHLDTIREERNMQYQTFEFVDDEMFVEGRYRFHGADGRHLTRSDGKMATVDLRENKKLFFVVWNENSPKIVDAPIYNFNIDLLRR